MRVFLSLCILVFGLSSGVMAQNQVTPQKTAVFAGGCFWCIESDFDKVAGVLTTVSGYIGGSAENAAYRAVSSGATEHYEALQVTYDPRFVSYDELLDVFWRHIDPFDAQGQFCDKGLQYRSAVFFADKAEQQQALASKTKAEALLGQDIVTGIIPATAFYPAEGYHQNYYKTNPVRYKFYRWKCGRDQRVEAIWAGVSEK